MRHFESLVCLHASFLPLSLLYFLFVIFFLLNFLVRVPVFHFDVLDVEGAAVVEVKIEGGSAYFSFCISSLALTFSFWGLTVLLSFSFARSCVADSP